MLDRKCVINLMLERQCLIRKVNTTEYIALYRDMQPGQNVYWNGFGDPPSLTFRAGFNDIEFNRKRQIDRRLIKGRFIGGTLGWIMQEDLELFASLFHKPLDNLNESQHIIMELLEHEGPLNIQQMKESTGMFVKEITPILHRLQEAFMIYEDQYDGEWDRAWYIFTEMFPNVNITKYTQEAALKILIQRFAYRVVSFDIDMVKSFYKLSRKKIIHAVDSLLKDDILLNLNNKYILKTDLELLNKYNNEPFRFVLAMHRNDFLVKSNEHWLKKKYKHPEYDTLQYLLIDGEFSGASFGRFRNGPYELEDVIVDLPQADVLARKDEILESIYEVNYGRNNRIKRYCGEVL